MRPPAHILICASYGDVGREYDRLIDLGIESRRQTGLLQTSTIPIPGARLNFTPPLAWHESHLVGFLAKGFH
jgi:hypothetical protein